MKVSGVVQFQNMDASAVNLTREFQRNHSDVRITFSANLADAKLEWESLESLLLLSRLVASIQAREPKQRADRQSEHLRYKSASRSPRP